MNRLSDQIYEIIIFLEMNFGQMLCSFFIWRLCRVFLQSRKKKKQNLLWIPIFYYITLTIFQVIPIFVESFMVYMIAIFVVFLSMVFLCKENIWIKIFLCITFFSVRFHVLSMINMILTPIFNFVSKIFHQVTDYCYKGVWQLSMVYIVINAFFTLLLDYIVFSFVIDCIIKNFPFQNKRLSGREMIFLLTPGILGSLCYFILHWILIEMDLTYGQIFFQKYPYLNFIIFLICFMILVSMLVVLRLFKDLEKKKEEEKRQEVLEHQIMEISCHIREIEQWYSTIQGMKHDIKNHITIMEELIEQQRYQETQTFLFSMKESIDCLDYLYKTGHPVTDVIINEKYKQAEKKEISFESKFHFSEKFNLDVFDISIILNNALENAIEAVEKERWKGMSESNIKVSSICRKQVYLIEVKNSFSGVIEWEMESNLPKSSKQDIFLHGIGLKNIQRVAEKYNGDIDIDIKNGNFILTVMLNMENKIT